ncbi:armadillo-type protein [Dipodascopsis uninucleata]
MDVNGLNDCFASTLDANPNVRRMAELQLSEASKVQGFISACLDIVLSQPNVSVQLAAAVYLKNKVLKHWNLSSLGPGFILEEEKPAFRERIIPAVISCAPQVRQHLVSTLSRIISFDYPDSWPTFLDHTVQLLQSQDAQHIFAGVICLNELSKTYKWKNHESRLAFDQVIEVAFPLALQIAGTILNETSDNTGEMMHMIMKSYRSAINIELSPRLQDQSALVPWGTLLLQVVAKDISLDSLPDDDEERELVPWFKAKKWAYRNLNKIFMKYGDPNALTDSMQEYKAFSKAFVTNFAPEILKAYLHQIQLWVEGRLWLSRPTLNSILEYFEECVKTKITWDILKQHVESLVSHVVFPLLCITDDDLDLFENEPVEYIHKRIDFFDDSPTPDIAATNFLVTLAEKRRKASFNIILSFVNSVVVEQRSHIDDMKYARQKEGALRMIGSLSHIILGKKSPVADMMESFFVTYIFPDFQSQFGFLRVRACELLNRFSDIDFKDQQNVTFIYDNITNCLNDKYLPVQVEAALALQPLVRHESIRARLSTDIRAMMEKLMELTKKIDMDSLLGVMEEFVDLFSEQLTPFAVQLAEELRDQFLRMLGEIIDKQNVNPENLDSGEYGSLIDDFADDKSMAALGILNTLGTLLLSLDSSPDVVAQIDHAIYPVISAVLEHDQTEMFGDVFELIDSSSFCLKRITPSMWNLFGLLHRVFKTSGMDYFDELLPSLENYILYGAEQMKSNSDYVRALIDIVNTVFTNDDRLGAIDRTDACRLIQTMLLNLKGYMDEYIPYLISLSLGRLSENSDSLKNKSYYVSLLEIIINCLYYNTALTLRILEEQGQTGQFFNLWFSKIDGLTRVHDKKLSIMAIINIITLPDEHIPASIKPGFLQLVQGLVQLLKSLPAAIKKREELSTEFNGDDSYYYQGMQNLNTGDWDDENEEDEDEAETDPQTSEYLEFLEKEANRLESKTRYQYDDELDDDGLEEEPLYESPLDNINVFIISKDAFMALQQDPTRSEILAKQLSKEENDIIKSTIEQAYNDEQQAPVQA